MSLKRENKFDANTKLSVLKLKTKDVDNKPVTPYFEVSEKNTEGKWVVVSQTDYVGGDLTKIEFKEKEFEGDKYTTVNLFFKDGNDAYLMDCRLNMLNRSLFNQLLSLTTFDNLSISTYDQKSKKDDKKVYPAISLRQNDELVHWKYTLNELPKPTAVTFKGKTMNDWTEQENYFINKMTEFSKLVNKGGKVVRTADVVKPETQAEPETAPIDDVPF